MAKDTPASATFCWGVPDPRDQDAYPKGTSETPMTQWAWEFLRRDEVYRARWEKLVKPLIKVDGTWDQETEYRQREEGSLFYVSPLVSLGAEFRVCQSPGNRYLDPRSGYPPSFEGSTFRQLSGYNISISEVKLPTIIFAFDARLPADPQFAAAKGKFQQDVKEWYQSQKLPPPGNARPQIGKFPTYLRLLDFERAPDNEIGSHLFPGKSGEALRDMISKSLSAARHWRQNYLLIALHPSSSSAQRF